MRRQLELVAARWLAQPAEIPHFEAPRFARVRLRLWHYPSLRGPWASVLLYQVDARRFRPTGMAPVVEVSWDRGLDGARVPAPASAVAESVPSVSWRQCLLPRDVVEGYCEALQRLTFNAFSPSGPGMDGSVRGVEAVLGNGAASVAWWGPAPEGLSPLAKWYDETWEAIQRHLNTARQAGGA
jgi:hypothetical protein